MPRRGHHHHHHHGVGHHGIGHHHHGIHHRHHGVGIHHNSGRMGLGGGYGRAPVNGLCCCGVVGCFIGGFMILVGIILTAIGYSNEPGDFFYEHSESERVAGPVLIAIGILLLVGAIIGIVVGIKKAREQANQQNATGSSLSPAATTYVSGTAPGQPQYPSYSPTTYPVAGQPGPYPSGQPAPYPAGQQEPHPAGQPGPYPAGQPGPYPAGHPGPYPAGQPAPYPAGQPGPYPAAPYQPNPYPSPEGQHPPTAPAQYDKPMEPPPPSYDEAKKY